MRPNDGAVCDHVRHACDDIGCPNGRGWMTKPRLEELGRLRRGRQSTYGSSRARVQRTLAEAGFARFVDERGRDATERDADFCVITDAGRKRLDRATRPVSEAER